MEKQCTCKKIVKENEVTLISECNVCYKKRIKELKLKIKLENLLIESKKVVVPEYKKGNVYLYDKLIADNVVLTPETEKALKHFNYNIERYGNDTENWSKQLNEFLKQKGLNESMPFGFPYDVEDKKERIFNECVNKASSIIDGFKKQDFHKEMLEADKELQKVCKPKNKCDDFGYGKIKGILYIPNESNYMCARIRKYYLEKRLIEFGYGKEQAKQISSLWFSN